MMEKASKLAILVFCTLGILAGCKKQISNVPDEKQGKEMQTSLTKEEYLKLNELMIAGKIKNSDDFLDHINTVKAESSHDDSSLFSKEKSVNTQSGVSGQQEIYVAFTSTAQEVTQLSFDDGSALIGASPNYQNLPQASFTGVCTQTSYFPVRDHQAIMFVVPHTVLIRGTNTVANVGPLVGHPPTIEPVGPNWGTYEQSTTAYVEKNLGAASNNTLRVYSMGREIRTKILSAEGNVKISTEANAGVFKAGTELGVGFTISSSANIYNQYILDGTVTVVASMQPYGGANIGYTHPHGLLKCTQIGILQN